VKHIQEIPENQLNKGKKLIENMGKEFKGKIHTGILLYYTYKYGKITIHKNTN
jgi:hypothetical protein